MLIHIPRAWEMKPVAATPERVFRDRRRLLRELGLGLGAAAALGASVDARSDLDEDAAGSRYPARRNDAYELDRPMTQESVAARHNVFDEFAAERDRVFEAAAGFRTDPWKVHVERSGTFWNDIAPDKYDFFANVDPAVAKPWPQTHEAMLGTGERRATLPYNGYAAEVARLYA